MQVDFLKKIVGNTDLKTAHHQTLHSFNGIWYNKTPCSRHQMVNLYTLYKTQDPEKHTLFRGTDLCRPNKGILAGGTAIDCCGHFMDETLS